MCGGVVIGVWCVWFQYGVTGKCDAMCRGARERKAHGPEAGGAAAEHSRAVFPGGVCASCFVASGVIYVFQHTQTHKRTRTHIRRTCTHAKTQTQTNTGTQT